MNYRVLLVGGGTAGHVEPALAVGNWLRKQSLGDAEIACEFLGTKFGIERDLVPAAGYKLYSILRAPAPRKLNFSALIWPARFAFSVLQSLALVRKFDLVVGFGGYVSAPAYLAAKLSHVPVIIHEANAKPGWANNLGSRFAAVNTVAFKSAQSSGANWRNAEVVGMPIRDEIRAVGAKAASEIREIRAKICSQLNLNPTNPIVFVFGGSLGSIDMNAAITGAKSEFARIGINLIQVMGKANVLTAATSGFAPFSYISEMADFYAASDLVISRSGAVTCAELMATGKFALLIPLPIGNGEQVANAGTLVADGRAEICDNSKFTSSWLAENILRLLMAAKKSNSTNKLQPSSMSAQEKVGRLALNLLIGSKK